ncbi:Uncharacterised protein [Cedecea neteri]|uniref:Uncharacterized protein n=1 Tax=Cedecea neteri TaxID=158822 RepID=A0A2X3J7C5_9ENTR|nr:Uncharacterised protein [Cedecea neteri]
MFSITIQMKCLEFLNNRGKTAVLLSGMFLIFQIKRQNPFRKIIINRIEIAFRYVKYFGKSTHHFKRRAMYPTLVLRNTRSGCFFLYTGQNTQPFLSQMSI